MATAAPKRMTVAEFLEWDDGTDTHYELVDGHVVAMAPTLEDHGAIVSNLAGELRARLSPPCRPISGAGIALPDRDDAYYEADVAVTCAPPQSGRRNLAEPVLVAEVLSPSTALHDFTVKLPDYRRIPSVREILLVSLQQRRVQVFRRRGEDWAVEDFIGDAELRLDAVGGEPIPLAAVYANVAV
jgi:Uma2 family endonuclease